LNNDEVLYQRVLNGDTGAFETLVERYHKPLFGFLYRMTGQYPIAEDLLQETFTRMIVYQGRAPDQFRAWVYTIAGNLARDHLRSAVHRREVGSVDDGSFDAEPATQVVHSVEDNLTANADRDEVIKALAQLTPEHREALVLRFYHDLTVDEIAAVGGIPSGTVKSRLSYALKRLKGLLAGVGVMTI